MVPHSEAMAELEKHDVLCSTSERYLVLEVVDQGCFGKVAKCINLRTAKSTTIKIHKYLTEHLAELDILKAIMSYDPEKTHLVEFMEAFKFQDLHCLAFEMLDITLWDLVKSGRELSLNEIRLITHQLLVAFEALKTLSIIHTDLKLDNIMLVDHQDQPFKVKLIDFGLAMKASKAEIGMMVQNLSYKAPEVMLGLPITEAIDMWALGCVLGGLFFASDLFPAESAYEYMKALCYVLGQPADYLLDAGMYTREFFIQEQGTSNPQWRLKTPKEYNDTTSQAIIAYNSFPKASELEATVNLSSKESGEVEHKDKMEFVDLLRELLDQDANTRITPSQALKHSFVTMTHLKDDLDCSSYAEAACELMAVCNLDDSHDSSDRDPGTDETGDGDSRFDVLCDADEISDLFSSDSFVLNKDDVITTKSTQYCVVHILGEGGFGEVYMCVDTKTSEKVAIKVMKEQKNQTAEVQILQEIKALDPDKTNMVKFIDSFMLQSVFCIVFEMLDTDLWDFMHKRQTPLSLNEIHLITCQLLVAFEALKTLSIIHTDVKLDNIMLVNHQDQPFKVKLIDFGLAMKASEAEIGMMVQNLSYKAPEVMLGLPITEAIDMWALGCVLGALFFGSDLFPAKSAYENMKALCYVLGQPADYLLDAGMYTREFFIQEQGTSNPQWRLKTPKEYNDTTGCRAIIAYNSSPMARKLEETVKLSSKEGGEVKCKDKLAFVDLLLQLLDQDANTRITPSQALKHSFVTLTHLKDDLDCSSYAEAACELMAGHGEPGTDESSHGEPGTLHEKPMHSFVHCDDTAFLTRLNDSAIHPGVYGLGSDQQQCESQAASTRYLPDDVAVSPVASCFSH